MEQKGNPTRLQGTITRVKGGENDSTEQEEGEG